MQGKKRTMWKRTLARLLVFAMLLTLLPVLPVGASDGGTGGEPPATETPTTLPTTPPTTEPTPTPTPTTPPTTPPALVTLNFTNAAAYDVLAVTVDGIQIPEVDEKYTVTLEDETSYALKMALQKKDDGMLYVIDRAWDGSSTIDLENSTMVPAVDSSSPVKTLTALDASGVQEGKPVFSTNVLGLTGKLYSAADSVVISADSASMTISDLVTNVEVYSVTVNLNKADPAASTVTKNVVPVTLTKATLNDSDVIVTFNPATANVGNSATMTASLAAAYYAVNDLFTGERTWSADSTSSGNISVIGNQVTYTSASDSAKVNVTVAESTYFNEVTASGTITVNTNPAPFTGIPSTIETEQDVLTQATTVKKPVTLPLMDTVTGQTYHYYDPNGTILFHKTSTCYIVCTTGTVAAGSYEIYAKVDPVTGVYDGGQKTINLTVNQSADFQYPNPGTIEWVNLQKTGDADNNRKAMNPVTSGTWTYALIDGTSEDIAEINTSTGELLIKKAGTIVVEATNANNVKKHYTLVVAPSVAEIKMTDVSVPYGTTSHETEFDVVYSLTGDEIASVKDEVKLTWSMDPKDHSIDANGKVTFTNQSGTVTVTASAVDEGRFSIVPASYGLTVNEPVALTKDQADLIFSTSTANGDNGWYKHTDDKTASENVVFTVVDSEYSVSVKRDFIDGDWKETITLADIYNDNLVEGDNLNATVYVKAKVEGSPVYYFTLTGIKADNSRPTLEINYSKPVLSTVVDGITKLFYNRDDNKLIVTMDGDDTLSGVARVGYRKQGTTDYITSTEKNPYTVTLDQEELESVVFEYIVIDRAGNQYTTDSVKADSELYSAPEVVVDGVSPEVTITYSTPACFVNNDEIQVPETEATTVIFNDDIVVKITVIEDHFDIGDCIINVNGEPPEKVSWDEVIGGYQATVTIPKEDNTEKYYTLTVSGEDQADNSFTYSETQYGSTSGATYSSKTLLIDTLGPRVELQYDGKKNDGIEDGFYTSRNADITVEDASFYSDACADGSAYSGVNAKNVSVVAATALKGTWTAAEATKWTKSIDFNAVDANYTFDLALKDNAGNPAVITVKGDDKGQNITNKDGKYHTEFTVDDTRPVVTGVTYSTSVPNALIDIITKIGEKTYAFFTNSTDSGKQYPLVITVTGEDAVSGVQEFTYTYTRDETASKTNKDTFTETLSYEDKITAKEEKTTTNYVLGVADIHEELKFVDPENGDKLSMFGQFTYLLTDYSGNLSQENSEKPYNDTTLKVGEVLDSIAPELTVEYERPSYYDALGKYFYNSTGVDVTFTMKEINFFSGEDVEIYVNSGNKGTYETGEFLRVNDVAWTPTGEADEYKYVFHMQHDTEYQFKVVYKDRSANNMNASDMLGVQNYEYYSPILVLDTTNPVVQISYNAPYQTTDIAYYNTTCTYNIHVTERNFDPVAATAAITRYLSAHNIDNVAQGVPAVSEWRNDKDEHYATIVFNSDARYEFDMIYTDPAGNTDLSADKRSFCVDTTAPSNLGISYNSDIAGQPTDGNSDTTIYGKDTVQVTLTAYDVTAGVETITYSGTSAAGVSAVNVPVNSTSVSVNANSSSVTHTFEIPAQFAGRVSFTAVDRSGNRTSTNEADEPLVIVDNMAPTANIVFTTTPSGYDEDDKPYYNQDFTITIEITEANFNSEDVTVTVLKDGAVESHDITWADGEGDVHTAEISLSGDGVYVVTVQYTDKSGNDMVTTAEYMKETGNPGEVQSEEMTLDTEDPELTITSAQTGNDAHDTAYDGSKDPENKDTIGFVIEANDTNLNKDSFSLSIEGYFVDDGDLHTFRKVDDVLAMDEDNDGEKDVVVKPVTGTGDYAVEIKNLKLDGVYRINATVEDYATNASTTPAALVSVNRNGSTFYIEDADLIGLLDNYYANEEIPVEIKEVNVEKLESSEMSVVRDSTSKKLEEGTEYTVDSESGVDLQDNSDHWNIYTYTAVKENFAEEGAYTVQTMSNTTSDPENVDAGTDVSATNTNQEGAEIKFLIDKTLPSGTFSGLIGGEHYNGESHEFTLSVNDNAELDSIVLFVDGQEIHPDGEVSGQDFAFTYTLPEKVGSYSVKFCAADKAGNLYDLGDDKAIQVYVNSNFILLYAKEFTVAGILLLVMIGVLVAVVVSRKKKAKAA